MTARARKVLIMRIFAVTFVLYILLIGALIYVLGVPSKAIPPERVLCEANTGRYVEAINMCFRENAIIDVE